jgi:SAM-dependent methyltransferase
MPWWVKVPAKLVLSRLPVSYSRWKKLGLFVHGQMDEQGYALSVYRKHLAFAFPGEDRKNLRVLELGPGDSLMTALIAKASCATSTHLVDVGPFAQFDVTKYRRAAEVLQREGLNPPSLESVETMDDFLRACSAQYSTRGLESLREVPDQSADFAFSHAVLEHVRRAEFLDCMKELRRILAPGGVSSHRVDLKDHLEGGLNNLRFSERFWETDLVLNSGFYTNRIRFGEMLRLFEEAGFEPEVVEVDKWGEVPLRRKNMNKQFHEFPDEDLRVKGFSAVLRCR